MFKSYVKKIALTLSSFAAILTAYQSASAQLNIGRYGIQPGLESNYLQYQMSGRDLSQMRAIPSCYVGFGAGCDKTAAVLQQLVESNGGPSYQELLMRAAGGEENFRNFASFYGNNPNLSLVPYASFWQNDNPNIMDSYRYLLGQTVSRQPQEGLGQVTKNFYWTPEGASNSLDPRSALLNLKYSYGRLLLEEVAKIPNLQQQIRSQDLPPEVRQFYANRTSQGLRALARGNEQQLEENILQVLSLPFFSDGAEYNRPNAGIPREFNQIIGQGLVGDAFVGAVPAFPEGEIINQELIPSPGADVLVQQGTERGFPFWVLAGLPLLLLPFLLGGGDDSSDNGGSGAVAAAQPPVGVQPGSNDMNPSGGETPINQIIEVPPTSSVNPLPGDKIEQVSEPSMLKPLLVLTLLLCIVAKRQWRVYGSKDVSV